MSIRKMKNVIQRSLARVWDLEHIQNVIYNESSGSQKNFNVEPVVVSAYTANDQVPFGTYIKVAAGTTAYSVACVGKAHSASSTYRRGDLVTQAGDVYLAHIDILSAHAFNAEEWVKVASATISTIPVSGGATICVGKYHNSINVAGFIVDDESSYRKVE